MLAYANYGNFVPYSMYGHLATTSSHCFLTRNAHVTSRKKLVYDHIANVVCNTRPNENDAFDLISFAVDKATFHLVCLPFFTEVILDAMFP